MDILDGLEEFQYSKFTQRFIEVYDEFAGLAGECAEFKEEGQPVPARLENEYENYRLKIEEMCLEGYNRWNKGSDELYRDGWSYWMKEDRMLREKRYGNR